MALFYTKHAKEMMNFRQINKRSIEICLKNPDYIVPVREEKQAYLKIFGNKFLKVICVEQEDTIIVITVYWIAKRRLRK